MAFRLVLLTGGANRHRHAAALLAARLPLAGIVAEIAAEPSAPQAAEGDEAGLIADHFARRDAAEARLLDNPHFPADVPRLEIGRGHVNDADTAAWVRAQAPDALLLYGCGLVKAPIMDPFPLRVINLHLGLSPYYRGTATNFWPLVDNRPECVGATIHLAEAAVDAGPILAQARPHMAEADDSHDVGTKALLAGLDAMARVVPAYLSGYVAPRAQELELGAVFRKKHFNVAAIRQMRCNFEQGMIRQYLEDRDRRDRAFPIVPPPA